MDKQKQMFEEFRTCMRTDHVRNSGIRCTILGLRAKVRIPRLRSAILGLRKFLLRVEHIHQCVCVWGGGGARGGYRRQSTMSFDCFRLHMLKEGRDHCQDVR